MGPDPNKLTNFWNELKRRKVFRVITMYAATAFIIMEAGDIMLPRLGLPDWTVTFLIVLLIVGFPISIILSWIFDLTPEGVKKTESIKTFHEESSSQIKRKLRGSDVIILVLIVVVGILIYPKIFKKDKFEGIRGPDGKISISVMPFENLSGIDQYNIWQSGFQNLLITTLSNSEELSVRQYQTMYSILDNNNANFTSITPSLARDLASKLKTRTFIIGNILKAGNNIRVTAQLLNTESEVIYKTFQIDGITEDDIFLMADSLSGLIKNYLEIKKLVEQSNSPYFHQSFNTKSAEAFQYYLHGYNAFMDDDFQTSIGWGLKAIEIDSNFISAYVGLAFNYSTLGSYEQAKKWCLRANNNRHELPLIEKLKLDHLNAYLFESPDEQINYLKQILNIEELNTLYWYLMGLAYYQNGQYQEAVIYFEKALEIHKNWGGNYRNPWNYFYLGESYHKINNHKRENEVYETGLDVLPDHRNITRHQVICALSQGNTDKANILIANYRNVRKNTDHWTESRILSNIGMMYSAAGILDEAESKFRQGLQLDPLNPERMANLAWFLIDNDINIDEGMDLINKALEHNTESWYNLDTKGWGLFKQGRYEEALDVLKDAWELRPLYDHEGYWHIQEVEQAIANQIQ